MTKLKILIFLFIISTSCGYSQTNMKDYTGSWQGKIKQKQAFNFDVVIENLPFENSVFKISNDHSIINRKFALLHLGIIEMEELNNLNKF